MTTLKLSATINSIYANGIVRRVASNFGWSIVSEAVGRGVFFITNIYLARTLGVSNFGLFTLAQTITFYFWLAVDLGTNMYGIREIAKRKENAEEIINPLLTLRIIAGLIVFTVYTASLLFFDMTAEKRLVFASAGLYLITYSFYTDWVMKGLEKFKYTVYGNLISSIVFLAGVFLFVKQSDNVIGASLIWALSYFFGSLGLIVFISSKLGIRYKPSFDVKAWLTHLRESIHFTFSGSLMALYQYLPILLISFFYGSYEVGLFSAPYRIVITICSAGFLIPMSFYPVFSELFHTDKAQFHSTHSKMQIIMLALGLPAAIIGTWYSDRIVELLLGSQYSASAGIFKILVWLVPLYFLRFTYGSLLLATGYQRHHNLASLVGVIFMLILGLYLIDRDDVIGGSWALVAAEASMVGTMLLVSKYTFQRKVNIT
jgi:O-antigen/teichoic acid export membrane protein